MKVIAFAVQMSSFALGALSFNTGYWVRGCTEEPQTSFTYVFGNACQDAAFGRQLLVFAVAASLFGLGWWLHERAVITEARFRNRSSEPSLRD